MRRSERHGGDGMAQVWFVKGYCVVAVTERLDNVSWRGERDDVVRGGIPMAGCVRPREDELGNCMRNLRNLLTGTESGIDDDVEAGVAFCESVGSELSLGVNGHEAILA